MAKIAINSKSTGKFEKRQINGRDHIVTSMVSIVGNSVMNRLAYPFDQVLNSFKQLDQLPTPAGHPTIDGKNASAFHPLAMNAFNIGGMALNPRMEGNKVINDLAIDLEVANKDDRGKEISRQIESGESIGVSTGLNADIDNEAGTMAGNEFSGMVKNIKFDHIALLPSNTPPAGSETFTVNADVSICNLADSVSELEDKAHNAVRQKFGDNAWASEILMNPDRIIVQKDDILFSVAFGYNERQEIVFTGEEIPVERKVTFEMVSNSSTTNNQRVTDMDLEKFVLALIANAGNSYTIDDKDKLMSMSETGFAAALSNAQELTIDDATAAIESAGLYVNNITSETAADYATHAEGFKSYLDSLAASRQAMADTVIANSKMTQEDVDAMSVDTLENLASSLDPGQNYLIQGALATNANSSALELDERY